ncbi:MAG: ATP-binding cassette domain-containing protein [Myxococcota bacterium]
MGPASAARNSHGCTLLRRPACRTCRASLGNPTGGRLPPAPTLRTDGLALSFGRHAVIRGLDLEVPGGSVYGFLGRNGAGKTTTLRMLMGILRPGGGTMTIGGDTVRATTAAMRRRIGYVSQQQHFYPWMRVSRLGAFVGAFYPTWDDARYRELCVQLAVLGAARGRAVGRDAHEARPGAGPGPPPAAPGARRADRRGRPGDPARRSSTCSAPWSTTTA